MQREVGWMRVTVQIAECHFARVVPRTTTFQLLLGLLARAASLGGAARGPNKINLCIAC